MFQKNPANIQKKNPNIQKKKPVSIKKNQYSKKKPNIKKKPCRRTAPRERCAKSKYRTYDVTKLRRRHLVLEINTMC